MSTFADRLNRYDNRANPVVVKELRQAFRGGVFAFILVGSLALMVILLAVNNAQRIGSEIGEAVGRDLFMQIAFLLQWAVVFVVPVYAGVRMAIERFTKSDEIYFMTGMRSTRIIHGKIKSAMLLALLIMSGAAPFAFICTLLRGVGLPSILGSLFSMLLFSWLGCVGTVCLCCQARGLVSAIVCFLFGLPCMAVLLGMSFGAQAFMVFAGPISVLEVLSPMFCMAVPTFFVLAVLYSGALTRMRGVSTDPYAYSYQARATANAGPPPLPRKEPPHEGAARQSG